MQIIKTVAEMQMISAQIKKSGQTIGFVPTMGALHNGHLSLFDKARQKADVAIASIFVNPTQFGPNEDYEKYPRTLEADSEAAIKHNIDYIFIPSVQQMYPEGYSTYVNIKNITEVVEGIKRPGHFNGVGVVLTKLFNIVAPDYAFFGQKDYQQTLVVKQLVKDLNIPVEIFVEPTVRLENGLAMSSRNKYLSEEERERATIIYKSLIEAKAAIQEGIKNRLELVKIVTNKLNKEPKIKIDYVCVALADSLKEVDQFKSNDNIVILIAAYMGNTRLIDNMLLTII